MNHVLLAVAEHELARQLRDARGLAELLREAGEAEVAGAVEAVRHMVQQARERLAERISPAPSMGGRPA